MVGYPIYNDDIQDTDKEFVSDVVLRNSTFFVYGFWLALITTPSVAFADELTNVTNQVPNNVANNVAPAPMPRPRPQVGHVPTRTRAAAHAILGIAGCGAAAKQCSDVTAQAANAATNKLSTVSPPTAIAVGGCLLLAGFCAGKLATKAVDRALGFG